MRIITHRRETLRAEQDVSGAGQDGTHQASEMVGRYVLDPVRI